MCNIKWHLGIAFSWKFDILLHDMFYKAYDVRTPWIVKWLPARTTSETM